MLRVTFKKLVYYDLSFDAQWVPREPKCAKKLSAAGDHLCRGFASAVFRDARLSQRLLALLLTSCQLKVVRPFSSDLKPFLASGLARDWPVKYWGW